MWKFTMLKQRKLKNQQRENFGQTKKTIIANRETVYLAIKELNDTYLQPVSGRQVSAHLHWDSASVTPRLAEIVRQGWVKVAYRKRGLDGHWRNFYRITK